jgi:cellobiose-specific phosphotransferase system component IIC
MPDRVEFSARVLFAAPMITLGVMAMILVLGVLAFFKSSRRMLAAAIGGVAGYLILGTHLAQRYADEAFRQHQCPDAAWGGPAAGLLRGAVVAIVVFEIVRFVARKREKGDPPASIASG